MNFAGDVYLLTRLPAYGVNRTKRLIKSPKLYWRDTGLALQIAGTDATPAHLENIVLCDLLALRDVERSASRSPTGVTPTATKVGFVVEVGDMLLPVEVEATVSPGLRDAVRLRAFRKEYAEQARAGLLLRTGDAIEWLTPDVLAAPWWRVI